MQNLDHSEILSELNQGICELVYQDEFSVEYCICGTLSENHLEIGEKAPQNDDKNVINLWNVRKEQWQTIPIVRIRDIERLTGIGVKEGEPNYECELNFINKE